MHIIGHPLDIPGLMLSVVILGMGINALFGLGPLDLSRIPQGLLMVVPIMTMTVITGGLNEELGWRGVIRDLDVVVAGGERT